MKYNKVRKIKSGQKLVGYTLYNEALKGFYRFSKSEAVAVNSNIEDFEYIEGCTPYEISFEIIITFINSVGDSFAFKKEAAELFIKYLKSDTPLLYEKLKSINGFNEYLSDGEYLVIGLPFNHSGQLN